MTTAIERNGGLADWRTGNKTQTCIKHGSPSLKVAVYKTHIKSQYVSLENEKQLKLKTKKDVIYKDKQYVKFNLIFGLFYFLRYSLFHSFGGSVRK